MPEALFLNIITHNQLLHPKAETNSPIYPPTMPELKAGDAFPEGVTFQYVPPTGQLDITACGLPVTYKASEGTFRWCRKKSRPCAPC